ncbi:Hsp20/alpha crystallin family protein [Xanthomonas massiliensis]|jgi:HSP20 family protein|uniref:Hsp20/alpha crystallin family protein n=1 Tax=Xanthomonas massiliensis TaxID=1720302 RepID=UPI000824FBFE|nr:Hsp20/alpha crystallin family protein [Xanthomonas massiliensis]
MNVMRYRQWPSQAAFKNELNKVFEQFLEPAADADESAVVTAQWVPRVDIKEEPDRFVLYADLPGIDPADIQVEMDKGILSIKGERKSEVSSGGEHFSRVERRYGSFYRRFALPDSADGEGITARGHNGVLEIRIPKKPASTPRRIEVGSGGTVEGTSTSVQ